MLTGPELGQALKEAIALKRVSQADVAKEFGVKQPSVSEWQKNGRISKKHLTHLVKWFSDVVGPEHWGLPSAWGGGTKASAEHWRMVAAAAVIELSARGMAVADPQWFLDFVDVLAEAIPEGADRKTTAATIVRHLRLVA